MKQWFEENMTHDFWTDLDEMVEDIEEYGYKVLEVNGEYIVVDNDSADEEEEIILYLGHANRTIWIESIR